MSEIPKRCARVRGRLPALVDGELSRPAARLVERHLRRCDACAEEADRQRRLHARLARMAEDEVVPDVAPPQDLLASLLEQAREPGVRERAAVPARGAVSGARPGLSVTLVVVVLSLVSLAGWAGWRAGRAWSSARREHG